MQKSIDEILNLVESVSGDEDVGGVVARYLNELVSPAGAEALVGRLDQRRDGLRRWEGIVNLVKRIHMQDAADTRHELETSTQAVLQAEDAIALARVAKEHPIVFTGTFIHSLIQLQREAKAADDDEAVHLLNNRLKHLQLLQLALIQNLEVTRKNLSTIVYQVLEARSFADLLDRFLEYPITFSESFDEILRDLAAEAGRTQADPTLPRVAELRIDVLRGLRSVVETFVHKRPAKGGPDDAVAALIRANQADKFLLALADFPFVLGEDFTAVLERELERARTEADENVVKGLERRMAHIQRIGEIIQKLTGDAEELERRAAAERQQRQAREEAMLAAATGAGELPEDPDREPTDEADA
jgi:hypothetical protein